MALSKEENDMLTQVGPGKPAGEMLRRYWQPIGFANELQEQAEAEKNFGRRCRLVSRRIWQVRRVGAALHAPRHFA